MHVMAISKIKLDYQALAVAMGDGELPILSFFHLTFVLQCLHHPFSYSC